MSPDFEHRSAFLALLARRLHEAGTSAARLEAALMSAGRRLKVDLNVWSSPTAVILGTRDHLAPEKSRTEVLRLSGGSINLRRLCRVDDIAERVINGQLNIEQGRVLLEQAAQVQLSRRYRLETLLGYALASCGVAGLIGGNPWDMLVAAVLSTGIGLLDLASATRAQLAQAMDALAAFGVALAIAAIGHFLLPITGRVVLVASLIVLLPGLTLTTAATEVATGHLVSGTARMTGAIATLLKLAFGALVGGQIGARLGWEQGPLQAWQLPEWVQWPSLALSALSFAMLFRARFSDYPMAMLAAVLAYLLSRYGSEGLGQEFGVFVAGFCIGLLANAYARLAGRPGAVVRLPGIILLVPGSVGFKTLSFVFHKDVFLGLDTAVSLLLLLVSLVAGLLSANALLPPRKAL